MRLAAVLLFLVLAPAFCEETPEDVIKKIQADIALLEASLPTVEQVKAAGNSEAAQVLRESITNDPNQDVDGLRAMIMEMNRKTLGEDALQQAMVKAMSPGGGMDPTAAMTFASGPEGLLWVFWAFDAPGIEVLPAQIHGAQKMLPQLVIRDNHVMPLSKWQDLLKRLSDLKDDLERITPGESLELAIARKKAQRDAVMPPLMAGTLMSRTRRRGGYLLIEDQSAGIAFHVKHLPMFVYLSPSGIVHRVKGINPNRSVAEWIVQTQTWERENQDVLKKRGVLK
jgi:hypothetical protein